MRVQFRDWDPRACCMNSIQVWRSSPHLDLIATCAGQQLPVLRQLGGSSGIEHLELATGAIRQLGLQGFGLVRHRDAFGGSNVAVSPSDAVPYLGIRYAQIYSRNRRLDCDKERSNLTASHFFHTVWLSIIEVRREWVLEQL